jgi:septal ring-binding cell division protein DamX
VSDDATDAPVRPAKSAARVGLTLGGIVLAAVVIFALGVMEGARVADSVPPTPPPPGALPTETLVPQPAAPAAATAPIPPDKLTFYDRLSGVAPAAPLALPEGHPPAQTAALVPTLAPAAQPAPQALPARQPEAAPAPPPERAPQKQGVAPAAAVVATRSAPAAKADPAAQIRKLAGKGRFTVQVAAASERAAAEQTTALVKRNGFEPVTVMASVKGKVWYRIRVGSFPTKQAATQAAGLFKSGFGLNAVAVEN